MSDTAKQDTDFHVEINSGPTQTITVKTSQYHLAAIAALAMLDYEEREDYQVVKIWLPELVKAAYGPYFYTWDGHRSGRPPRFRQW